MPSAISVPAGLAGYAALISEFPLRPIRNADEHARALAVVRSLMGGGLDEGESDYLEILVGLVERYEERTCPISQPSDSEMLRFLLESRGLSQATLARGTGIAESAISEVLSGKKALRRQHIGAIACFFRVSPAIFRFDMSPGESDPGKGG
jgi:HTH-type transcriptional regulator/antitoxin HigA